MQAVVFSVTNLYLPSLPKVAEYFAINKVQAQFSVSLYFLGLFIFTVISHTLIEKLGEIKTVIYGAVIFIVASIFGIFSEDFLWLKICLFILAFSAGPMAIISRALLGSIEKKNRRVAMSNVYLVSSLISSMLAPLVGGLISFFIWWQFVFVVCTIFGLVILWRTMVFHKDNKEPKQEMSSGHLKEYLAVLANKGFLFWCGIKWALYSASQAFYVEVPFILHHQGFNARDIGIIIVITGTGFIFGSFFSRIFAKSLEASRIIATAIIISIIGGMLCFYQAFHYDTYIFIFAAWIMMVGMGMSASNLMMLVLEKCPKNLHTKMSALYNMITLFLCFVVTGVVGHISNYSVIIFYSLFLGLSLVAMLLFLGSKVTGCFKNI
jgi:DHA1 family bicyclomycin/chloramphenicol resistance-like MFS transporter